MLNRLKNAMATLAGDVPDYPASDRRPRGRLRGSGGGGGGGEVRGGGPKRTDGDDRLPYSRPHFLHLSVDEVTASGDKTSRPIILPRDVTKVPWCAGYAEVINAGKSELNEDQARAERIILKNVFSRSSKINKVNDTKPVKDVTFPQTVGNESNVITTGCLNNDKGEAGTDSPAVNSDSSNEVEGAKETEQSNASTVGEEANDEKNGIHNGMNSSDKIEVYENEEDTRRKQEQEKFREEDQVTMTYFGIFDGHAGYGAAVMAAASLHDIITDNLLSIIDLLSSKKATENSLLPVESTNSNGVGLYSCCICKCHNHQMMQSNKAPLAPGAAMGGPVPILDKTSNITAEELVIGAIEKSFNRMDRKIEDARRRLSDAVGGCTALTAIFFMGRLYIANAGDCRAVICRDGKAVPVSFDFTPETERKRICMLANLFPHLLHNEFTDREFVRRPTRKDVGKKLLCREAWMSGWSLHTVKVEDLRVPVITGEGKRARLLSTIGVTRGLGDHNLRLYDSDIRIKPFLSSVPDVKVIDMNSSAYTENDVLIMASDGLWDVISSDHAAIVVQSSLSTAEISNPKRYTLAAQDLLMHARGMHQNQWKTIDDITVFVIPLYCYGNSN